MMLSNDNEGVSHHIGKKNSLYLGATNSFIGSEACQEWFGNFVWDKKDGCHAAMFSTSCEWSCFICEAPFSGWISEIRSWSKPSTAFWVAMFSHNEGLIMKLARFHWTKTESVQIEVTNLELVSKSREIFSFFWMKKLPTCLFEV